MAAHSGPYFELLDQADWYIDARNIKYGPSLTEVISDSNMTGIDMDGLGEVMTYDSTVSACYTTALGGAYKIGIPISKQLALEHPPGALTTTINSFDMNGSSFMLWFKTANTNYSGQYTGRATLLGTGYFTDAFGPALWLQNGPPYRIFAEGSVNNENWIDVSSAIPANSWNNLTCVFSGGNTATSYLNGVEIDEVTSLTGSAQWKYLGGGSGITNAGNVLYSIYARWNSKALTYTEVQDLHIAFRSRHGIV